MASKATLRQLRWGAATLAAMGLWLAAAAAQTSRARAPSAYEGLDDTRLAEALQGLGMTELLEELARSYEGGDDEHVRLLLLEARISKALGAPDQQTRDEMLDEVIAEQDKLIAEMGKTPPEGKELAYYNLVLSRIVTEGITKLEPYIFRIQYFHERPDDRKVVEEATGRCLSLLGGLTSRMRRSLDYWVEDKERWISGEYWTLRDQTVPKAAYRGAWIRLYRVLALPKDDQNRTILVRQAIEDVREYASAGDDSSGVKFNSLLLTGMGYRLLGQYGEARSALNRAADRRAQPLIQLKARFEAAVSYIDEGNFAEAQNAIGAFRTHGMTLVASRAIGTVTVDLQAALLESHLLGVRSEAIRAKDPKAAEKLSAESLQKLLDFVEKRPAYKEHLMELIAAKYEGKDPAGLAPAIKVALGVRAFSRRLPGGEPDPEGLAEADKLLSQAMDDPKADDALKANALWYLGLVGNLQRKNLEAADRFRRLAAEYPHDSRAKKAAEYAVKSLEGVLIEKEKDPKDLGQTFLNAYRDALRVTIALADRQDPQLNAWHYKLGNTLKDLNELESAKAAYDRISRASDLYLPARFGILSLEAGRLLRDDRAGTDRQSQAIRLTEELTDYRNLAAEYAGADPQRVKTVRQWGAETDLMIARLRWDVLKGSAQAVQHVEEASARWAGVPGFAMRCQQFIVRVWLEEGKLEEAVKLLLQLLEKDPVGAEELVAEAVQQIRDRLETLQYSRDTGAAKSLAALRRDYKGLAERLRAWATDKVKPDQMYGFDQALAGALEWGDKAEAQRALSIYQALASQKNDDPINVRGLARCHRRLGMAEEAAKEYDRLVEGLASKSDSWWRAQLERLEFWMETDGSKAEALEKMLLHIRSLRFKDSEMGGSYLEHFNRAEARIADMLKTAGGARDPKAAAPGE